MAEPQKSGDKPVEANEITSPEMIKAAEDAKTEQDAIAEEHKYKGEVMTEEEYLGYDPEEARKKEVEAIKADAEGDYEKARELRSQKKPSVRRSTNVSTTTTRERDDAESERTVTFSPYERGADPVEFSYDFSFNYYPGAYERPGPVVEIHRLSACP